MTLEIVWSVVVGTSGGSAEGKPKPHLTRAPALPVLPVRVRFSLGSERFVFESFHLFSYSRNVYLSLLCARQSLL